MLGHQSAKANLTVFRWQANDGPLLWCLDPLSHHQLKKTLSKLPPPPPPPPLPRTKFSGWVVMFYVRSQGHHVLTTTAVALILDIMLSLRLCLRPTIIADSLSNYFLVCVSVRTLSWYTLFRTFRMQQDTPRSAQQFVKITDYTSVLKCSILRNLIFL